MIIVWSEEERVMTASRIALLAINIVGGVAVLGSYVLGIRGHPGQADRLWGGVPEGLRGVYGVSMLLAAVGYLLFFYHVEVRMDPAATRLPWGWSHAHLAIPFVLILLPSAFWMSLTFAYIAAPSMSLWIAVRAVLGVVAGGSVLMLVMLAGLKVASPEHFWWPSVLGVAVFTFHTLVLDALLWPALFRG
jgi:hypothetical protein